MTFIYFNFLPCHRNKSDNDDVLIVYLYKCNIINLTNNIEYRSTELRPDKTLGVERHVDSGVCQSHVQAVSSSSITIPCCFIDKNRHQPKLERHVNNRETSTPFLPKYFI